MESGINEIKQLIDISYFDLFLATGLVVVVIGLSRWQDLGIHRSVIIGTIRCIIQLIAIGYILGWIFDLNRWPLVAAYALAMVLVAAHTVYSSQKTKARRGTYPLITLSLFIGGLLTFIVIQYFVVVLSKQYQHHRNNKRTSTTSNCQYTLWRVRTSRQQIGDKTA